jgi:hypothetical protein
MATEPVSGARRRPAPPRSTAQVVTGRGEQARVQLTDRRQPSAGAGRGRRAGSPTRRRRPRRHRRGSGSARRPRRRGPVDRLDGPRASMRSTTSAAGTTRSRSQPLVVPTSMNSMNRRVTSRCRGPTRRGPRLVVVDAALQHGVDLDRPEAGGSGRLDPVEHAEHRTPWCRRRRGRWSSSSASRLTVTRCRPAVGERRRVLGSRSPLVVSARSSMPVDRREPGDEVRQVATQQRLAAGQPDLGHPELDERPHDPLELLEAQQLVSGEEGVVGPEHLARHAVAAAQVAAVGDGDDTRRSSTGPDRLQLGTPCDRLRRLPCRARGGEGPGARLQARGHQRRHHAMGRPRAADRGRPAT